MMAKQAELKLPGHWGLEKINIPKRAWQMTNVICGDACGCFL
jgi:hypothetical protein